MIHLIKNTLITWSVSKCFPGPQHPVSSVTGKHLEGKHSNMSKMVHNHIY